ncbi:hypothetical protein JCM5353_006857 [Sporobolomyces roseus]
MEINISGGLGLKHFTRALTCLSKFGEELDFLVTRERVSISTVNSSRTAFGVVHFYPNFFQQFALSDERGTFKFSVTAKALLSPLRPRSANTIESCSIVVGSEDPNIPLEPGVDAGECRIIIRLHCQHGVVKTHRLTYGNPNVNNWARFDKNHCSSSWKASSKVLKEWTDHFYLRSGTHALTDEITFYCSPLGCRLKSFSDPSSEQNMTENEIMTSRPLTTELTVDTEDFDTWDIPSSQIITFALKEFKAIINLSESLNLPIMAHFTTGGRPLMVELEGDHLESKFVVATTDYDSGGGSSSGSGSVKREKSESVSQKREREARSSTTGANGANGANGRDGRLFNDPTPSPAPQSQQQQQQEEDEDFGGMEDQLDFNFDDAEAAFGEIDRLSQVALSQQPQLQSQQPRPRAQDQVLVRDTSEAGPSNRSERFEMEEDEEFGKSPEPEATDQMDLGPTQRYVVGTGEERPNKKSKWNILDDD